MGHSLATTLRLYSNGTDAAHKAEMGAFLASVEKTVLNPGNDPAGSIRSAVGICIEFHKPAPIADSVTVQPDCRSTEGCLFCDQYRVHADAVDIRKLLSCRHCVTLVSGRAGSIEPPVPTAFLAASWSARLRASSQVRPARFSILLFYNSAYY